MQGKHCARGTPIKFGTHVRLQHTATRRWLHSHHFQSPLTNNQEVCSGLEIAVYIWVKLPVGSKHYKQLLSRVHNFDPSSSSLRRQRLIMLSAGERVR